MSSNTIFTYPYLSQKCHFTVVNGLGSGENGKMLVKGYKVSDMQDKYILEGGLMHSRVTIVNNTVLYT